MNFSELFNSVRFPKKTQTPVTKPTCQISADEYNALANKVKELADSDCDKVLLEQFLKEVQYRTEGDSALDKKITAQYVTLASLQLQVNGKVNSDDLVTVNNKTLINKGANIDTTPDKMNDSDVNEIFNNLK